MIAVVCGQNIHKESTYATVMGPDGDILVQGRMTNQDVPSFLEPLKVDKVAMEASTYIIPMYRGLVENGYHVTVSHPRRPGTSPGPASSQTG
jgi:hypothetical protein